MCFTILHGKRLGETLKLSKLSRVSGASRSRPASRKLQRLVSVSSLSRSRSRLGRSRAHPCSDDTRSVRPIKTCECSHSCMIKQTCCKNQYVLASLSCCQCLFVVRLSSLSRCCRRCRRCMSVSSVDHAELIEMD